MKRKLLILSVSVIALAVFASLCLAQEEGEKKKVKALEFKIRGQLIPHPDKNEVKVMTDDFQVFIMPVNKGATVEVTVKGKLADLAVENEVRLPKGEVTYSFIDGKPVITKITYPSGETWTMEPPKPREE